MKILREVLAIGGAGCIITGCWRYDESVGLVVAGIFLLIGVWNAGQGEK